MMRTSAGVVFWFLVGGAVAGARAQAQTDATAASAAGPLEILYHADLDGRLGALGCGKPGPVPPDYAATVAAVLTQAADGARPIVLLGGNQAAPDVFGRRLLAQGAAGARTLAALFARGGYDAVALGHHELALEPAQLDGLMSAVTAAGLPLVATNLTCDTARRPACAGLRRELLVRRGDLTVGVLAIVSRAVLPGIPPGRLAGIVVEDPLAAARAGVARLRARGARRIVLMTQGPRGAGALAEADTLQRALAAPPSATASDDVGLLSPDLVLAGGLADDESGRALRLLRRDGAPPLVGSAAGTSAITRIRVGADGRVEVDTVPATAARRDPPTAALLAPLEASLCQRAAEPVSSAPLRQPLGQAEFLTYLLEVMRRRAGAEIALINRAFVKRTPFPLAGRVTRGDLNRALPYRAVLGVTRVRGPNLESLLGGALANPKAAAAGLTRPRGPLLINGRPVDKARDYRLATIAFVAAGGDGIVPSDALSFRPLPGEPDLREVLEGTLGGADLGPAPADLALFVGLFDLGLDLTDTTISNGAGYGDAQLSRAQQTSIKTDGAIVGQLRHPRHEGDARLALKYGWARTHPQGAPATSGENADLVTGIVIYSYRGFRDWRRWPKPAIPDPYARVWIESELTQPPVGPSQPRTFHHLLMTDTLGAQLTLRPQLKVRGGAGARKELLASGSAGRWLPVVEVGATLDPVAIATWGALAVKLEGYADYNFVDPSGTREHQLRSTARLAVPLVPYIFLTTGLDVFVVQRERRGWSSSFDTTIGLRVHLDAAHQRLH